MDLSHGHGPEHLVDLDADHPGFRDASYRARRNEIARVAREFRRGQPVPRIAYTPEEDVLWGQLLSRLQQSHSRFACRQVLEAYARLPLAASAVPQLCDVNTHLARLTGFQMEPVAGLVTQRAFLERLGDGVFLSTQYIRHTSRPSYTPEPDVVHELVGHAPTLAHDDFVELSRAFGQAAQVATEDAQIDRIARLYWFTLEYGLVREAGDVKVVGAGILSSAGEMERFESQATLKAFDAEVAATTPYDPTDFQPLLFVAADFKQLKRATLSWLEGESGQGP